MRDPAVSRPRSPAQIPAMSQEAIDKVRRLESASMGLPQVALETRHVLHGGMYARTIHIPAGAVLTGALIKIATLLIVEGDVVVYLGEESKRLKGYNVLPASAGRKQAFFTQGDVHLTMIFPTDAKTVEQAEREFTDEVDCLGSRRDINHFTITGE